MKRISLILAATLFITSVMPVYAGELLCSGQDEGTVCENNTALEITTSDTNSPEKKIWDSVSAEEAAARGLLYEVNNNEITITRYTGTNTTVTVPGEIDGIRVTKIGVRAFSGMDDIDHHEHSRCWYLQEIILPDTITEIGEYAFIRCENLKSFDMPDSVKKIGKHILQDCSSVEAVKISNNIDNLCCMFNSPGSGGVNIKKMYLPKLNILDDQDCQYFNDPPDIYYSGSIKDWRSMEFISSTHGANIYGVQNFASNAFFRANLHFNSTVEDYRNGKDAGKGDDWNAPYDLVTVSLNDSITVTYYSSIAFYGKKANPENFRAITISYNGQEYKASKIKVNKDKNKFQITDISPADKQLKKTVKQLTKGNKGLGFNVGKYYVTYTSDVKLKYNIKAFKCVSASVKINGKYYKTKPGRKCLMFTNMYLNKSGWVIIVDENVFGVCNYDDSLLKKILEKWGH